MPLILKLMTAIVQPNAHASDLAASSGGPGRVGWVVCHGTESASGGPTGWWAHRALRQPARASLDLAAASAGAGAAGHLSLEGMADLGHYSALACGFSAWRRFTTQPHWIPIADLAHFWRWWFSSCAFMASPLVGARLNAEVEAGTPAAAGHTLARSLSERDLLYLFVGSVIGSGIFLTPGLILRQLGGSIGYSLLVWLLGGVLVAFGRAHLRRIGRDKSRGRRTLLLHPRRVWPVCPHSCTAGRCFS